MGYLKNGVAGKKPYKIIVKKIPTTTPSDYPNKLITGSTINNITKAMCDILPTTIDLVGEGIAVDLSSDIKNVNEKYTIDTGLSDEEVLIDLTALSIAGSVDNDVVSFETKYSSALTSTVLRITDGGGTHNFTGTNSSVGWGIVALYRSGDWLLISYISSEAGEGYFPQEIGFCTDLNVVTTVSDTKNTTELIEKKTSEQVELTVNDFAVSVDNWDYVRSQINNQNIEVVFYNTNGEEHKVLSGVNGNILASINTDDADYNILTATVQAGNIDTKYRPI